MQPGAKHDHLGMDLVCPLDKSIALPIRNGWSSVATDRRNDTRARTRHARCIECVIDLPITLHS